MHTLFSVLQKHSKRFFYLLVAFDLIVLLMHLSFGAENHFFHVDFEQNLPTVYQSLKLIFSGVLFFIVAWHKKIPWNMKSFLLPLATFLLFLGLDELFQIHENMYRVFEYIDIFHPSKLVEVSTKLGYRSSLWILYYLPIIFIFVFWSGYWLRYLQSHMKGMAPILLFSCTCLFVLLLAEVLSSTGTFTESTYFWLVSLEESAEMLLATSLFLLGSTMLKQSL